MSNKRLEGGGIKKMKKLNNIIQLLVNIVLALTPILVAVFLATIPLLGVLVLFKLLLWIWGF